MGKLYINATKNFGNKIENAIINSEGKIDGIHYSLGDIQNSKKELLVGEGITILSEFPLYYLTTNNDYLQSYLNRDPVLLENDKEYTPNENNNKMICMEGHIDFSCFKTLPLTSYEYATNRELFHQIVRSFYQSYYKKSYLMTPTFIFDKVNSWEDIMMIDTLESTKEYLQRNEKEEVILSILLDPALLEMTDVAASIKNYVRRFNYINSISLTLISDESMYYYSKDVYKNVLAFLKELRASNISVYLQYCGIKDIVFSVLDIKRFSVGWFGSYRNFDTNARGITEISSSSFGKRVRKVLSLNYMSEVPLSYLDVLSSEQCLELTGIKKESLETTNYNELEQIYWKEMLRIIKKDENIEKQYLGDELINHRCQQLLSKLKSAEANLQRLASLLRVNGRDSDAAKLERGNLNYVNLYIEAITEYKQRLFF